MRQSMIVAIFMIAIVGSVAGADPFSAKSGSASGGDLTQSTWYRCDECFVVRAADTTPCPVCRSDKAPLMFEPTAWELCPVCGSVDVDTQNPKGAHACQSCGIVFRHPRPRTLSERFRMKSAAVLSWREAYLHGFLESKGFVPTVHASSRAEGRLQLSWESTLSETTDVAVTFDVRGDTANLAHGVPEVLDDSHRTTVGIHEAKVTRRGEALDLTFGKFTLPWGRADRINPTNPMPYDYADLLDNERIGVFGTSAKYSWGVASSMELVCFPWATPSILPSAESEWFFPPFDLSNREELLRDLRDEQGIGYGTRFSSMLATVDWSLSWFDGIETAPALRLGLPLRLVYNPYRAIGMDFETTWHGLGIRGETAYRTHDSDRGDASFRSIVGLDYRWEDVARSRDTLHCFLSYARDDVQKEGEDVEYPYPFTNSLVGKLEYGYDADTSFALSIVATIDSGAPRFPAIAGGDWYLQPEIRRTIGGWNVTIGADILAGPHDSFFGFFGENDRVTIGLKKEF